MVFNIVKTALLLVILNGLLFFVGGLVGGSMGIQIALLWALLINGVMFFFSDKIVLSLYGAQKLDPAQFKWIYTIVEDLTERMSLPMPQLWLVKTSVANAFATGRSPRHASVALTTGILDILDEEELRGVLAHELAHIKNRDTLITTIAATIASAISYLAYMLRNVAFWGSVNNNRRRENPVVLFFVGLLLPVAATLVQLAISRSREYGADETGARSCQTPLALASALQKLHNNTRHAHMDPADTRYTSTASLFITNPFTAESLVSLFSTHPPIEKRVARLYKLSENLFS